MKFKLVFILVFSFFVKPIFSINMDSLRVIIDNEKIDSLNYKARIKFGYHLLSQDRQEAMLFADTMVRDAKNRKYPYGEMYGWVIKANGFMGLGNNDSALTCFQKAVKVGKSDSLYKYIDKIQMFVGVSYSRLAMHDESIEAMQLALKWAKEGKDTSTISSCNQNLGHVFFTKGDYNNALKSYLNALKVEEDRNNYPSIAFCQTNLGVVYREKKDYDKSIFYFKKSIENYKKLEQVNQASSAQAKLGHLFVLKKDYDQAEIVLMQALNSQLKNNYEVGLASTYNSLGFLYKGRKDNEAITYYNKAAEYAKKFNNEMFLGGILINLGSAMYNNNNSRKAIPVLLEGIKIADSYEKIEYVSIGYNHLSKAYEEQGSYKNALKYNKLHLKLKDSLLNKENLMQMNELEASYESEKKEKEILLLNEKAKVDELTIQDEKQKSIIANEQKKSQQLMFGLGIGFLLVITLFIYRGYQSKKKSNVILTQQKLEIEKANDVISLQRDIVNEKNKEITDSIQYAKRIQNAILPPDKLVKEYLADSFILYKPKDIVAGDFYWMESVAPTGKNDAPKVLFAAADCTGHGVPGAMVSVVCNNGLNRSVREYGLTEPGEILDKTREIVIQEFAESEEDVQDGMDIALCSLEGNILKYAGANNPLWIIRNGEIVETKANKQPIGKFDNPTPYITHTIQLEKGDSIYIFSDGYIDQFGGEKGKKLKASAFRELLLKVNDKTLSEQKLAIDQAFEDWRGDNEQVDDVCVIGVKV